MQMSHSAFHHQEQGGFSGAWCVRHLVRRSTYHLRELRLCHILGNQENLCLFLVWLLFRHRSGGRPSGWVSGYVPSDSPSDSCSKIIIAVIAMVTICVPTSAVRAFIFMVSTPATWELSRQHSYIGSNPDDNAYQSPYKVTGFEQCYPGYYSNNSRKQKCTKSECQYYSYDYQYRLHLSMLLVVKRVFFAR